MEIKYKYEAYSDWSRLIAYNYTKEEIETVIYGAQSKRSSLAKSHLNAINKSTSMQSNSQARAQTGNSFRGNYEKLNAYENALEIHDNYPDKSKQL